MRFWFYCRISEGGWLHDSAGRCTWSIADSSEPVHHLGSPGREPFEAGGLLPCCPKHAQSHLCLEWPGINGGFWRAPITGPTGPAEGTSLMVPTLYGSGRRPDQGVISASSTPQRDITNVWTCVETTWSRNPLLGLVVSSIINHPRFQQEWPI